MDVFAVNYCSVIKLSLQTYGLLTYKTFRSCLQIKPKKAKKINEIDHYDRDFSFGFTDI